MGSTGWRECSVCGYWVYDPYLLDPVGHPVCDWCLDWEDRWARCYWCGYWQYDALSYVGDDYELYPLCDCCLDWLFYCWGGPYEPSAQTRCVAHLRLALAGKLVDAPLFCIAECLYDWFEP